MRQYGITKCTFLTELYSSRTIIYPGELVYTKTIKDRQGLMTMDGCFIPVTLESTVNSNGGVRWIENTRLLRLVCE